MAYSMPSSVAIAGVEVDSCNTVDDVNPGSFKGIYKGTGYLKGFLSFKGFIGF